MPGDIVMTKNQEERKKSNLNNDRSEIHMNRGIELMLRQHNRREKPSRPKSFLVRFGKMLSLFKREIHFQFEIFLDIKKK
jgi:hypothetical protein